MRGAHLPPHFHVAASHPRPACSGRHAPISLLNKRKLEFCCACLAACRCLVALYAAALWAAEFSRRDAQLCCGHAYRHAVASHTDCTMGSYSISNTHIVVEMPLKWVCNRAKVHATKQRMRLLVQGMCPTGLKNMENGYPEGLGRRFTHRMSQFGGQKYADCDPSFMEWIHRRSRRRIIEWPGARVIGIASHNFTQP